MVLVDDLSVYTRLSNPDSWDGSHDPKKWNLATQAYVLLRKMTTDDLHRFSSALYSNTVLLTYTVPAALMSGTSQLIKFAFNSSLKWIGSIWIRQICIAVWTWESNPSTKSGSECQCQQVSMKQSVVGASAVPFQPMQVLSKIGTKLNRSTVFDAPFQPMQILSKLGTKMNRSTVLMSAPWSQHGMKTPKYSRTWYNTQHACVDAQIKTKSSGNLWHWKFTYMSKCVVAKP